jgi:Cu/Ag efflux protein CusF
LFSALALAGASWFIATPSFADQPSPADQPSSGNQPSSQEPATTITQRTKKISATATVDKVDAQKRDLTLRNDDGTEFTVEVPKTVKLDQIREGDRVKIDYYEAVGLSLKKPQPGAQPRSDETTVTEHKAGKLPGGVVTHRISATVEVVRVDPAGNRVTVRRPDGTIDTVNVTDPAMRAQLANMHQGDRIQATYTEAAAITVLPEAQPSPQNQQTPQSQDKPQKPQSEQDQQDQQDQQDLANPPNPQK